MDRVAESVYMRHNGKKGLREKGCKRKRRREEEQRGKEKCKKGRIEELMILYFVYQI